MSNLDECCLFGVLTPSGNLSSLGVDVNLSKAPSFCPGRGGARSLGMVSAAPGGGMCFILELAYDSINVILGWRMSQNW